MLSGIKVSFGWVSIEAVQINIEEMRRPGGPGHYGDSGGNAYVNAQMQHMSGQRMEHKSEHYQGRQEPMTSDKGRSYGASKAEGQWRWERDGTKAPNAMSSQMFSEGKLYDFISPFPLIFMVEICLRAEISQGGDAPRAYYQGQRPDSKMASEKQGNHDPRSLPPEEDMDIGYEDKHLSQTFEGVEKRFLDDITKLSKEQIDAEDAENARHREPQLFSAGLGLLKLGLLKEHCDAHRWKKALGLVRVLIGKVSAVENGAVLEEEEEWRHFTLTRKINTINTQYQEQLAALRARHANRRDEYLRRESHARQQQYQQAMMDHYPNSGMGPNDPHGYGGVDAAAAEPNRAYNGDQYDSYRERARFLGEVANVVDPWWGSDGGDDGRCGGNGGGNGGVVVTMAWGMVVVLKERRRL
ncbi:hypothetical protein RHGRI_002129 [Rhododendron griersonianum]|uniref:Uncharacterized protein n=1 Tax=Rhododendron griersonianum TaxID=479676 RepID=A0AAV6LMN6_9ERIC|nr:hypothetical protein RHGRI_002129 [Rhododendron griersonianum]